MMNRLLILIAAMLVVLSVPGMAAQQQTSDLPLQAIDSNPLAGQELGSEEPITIFFDQPINCDTAEGAVSLVPAIEGTVSCDGSSLTFTPSAAYPMATQLRLTVNESLQAQSGAALAEVFTLELNTLGTLMVSEVLPDDGAQGIETDAVITVIFNRPVVPLVSNEDRDTLPDPLAFEPVVEGEGEWLNTSIYVFRPEPALSGGINYTVTVNEGLTAVDGAVLSDSFSWSFTTVEPAIVETSPLALATGVLLDEPVQVRFNQPMDQASIESSFYLRPEGQESGSVEGTLEWNEDGTSFTFTPAENLLLDTFYDAGFEPGGALSLDGNAVLGDTHATGFNTIPEPGVVGTNPFTGADDVDVFSGFTIYFASPMNQETLQEHITIEPEPFFEPNYYYYDWDNSYNISFVLEPSTDYTVTIAPGMEDIYGNVVERGRTITFSTAPYDPQVILQAPRSVGLYNAYNDETQVFVTHRNVSQLDLELFSVPTLDLVGAITTEPYDPAFNYAPSTDQLLAQWTIPSTTPENQIRYELLELGDQARSGANTGTAIDCPGALPSRLKVGDTAIVVTEPDPVSARALPVNGDVIQALYRDYQLPVEGGPVCANSIVWWEVRLRGGELAWVAEGADGEYYLDLLAGAEVTPVDLPQGLGTDALAPGAYILRITAPEIGITGNDVRHFVMVSTANLTMKATINEVLIWATDVQTGAPIPNAPISLYTRGSAEAIAGVTDADGLVRFDASLPLDQDPFAPRVAVLETPEHFGVSTSEWTQGIEPYQFGAFTDYPAQYKLYLYTDRPVYRPGQPVYFKGIVRSRDDVTYTPPTDFDTVPVKIFDEMGEIVYEEDAALTPFGTFAGQFELAEDAGLGFYRLNVDLPSEREFYYEGGGINFSVAEYRVPEFQVEMTPEQTEVVQNDTIRVQVHSTYFFGGMVSNASVDYTVQAGPYFFNYDGPGFYDFYDIDADSGPGEFYGFFSEEIASGSGTTDSEGNYMIELPADLEDAAQSQTWTIEATVRDESGLTVSGRTDVIVHKGEIYIGARPTEYVGYVGEESTFEIIAVDWDSQPVANQAIEVEVVERRWHSVQEEDEMGRTTWTWEVEEIPVTTGSVTTDEQGEATFSFTPPAGGVYKVKISTRDAAGNDVIAATTQWVSGNEYVAWRQQNSNRIDLIADQTDYLIGDTASILIASPFQGEVEALVTVERGKVLTAERITMENNSYVYELPITEDYAPNVFVTVMIVKGVDETNPVAGFRMGMVELGVEIDRKIITIEATPDKAQAGPRDTVTYTIQTTDWEGNPVQAEVGVALTDLASLSVGDPNSDPILQFFYGQQGNSVRTGTPLTINTDQYTQTVIDTIKGGGGGFGEGGIFDIRQDFVDTAFWNAFVRTDENGQAEISVLLPDNLTTWRLDTRAVTSGEDGLTLVGQNTFDLLSTKPLLIRPVTPRFAVVDDTVTLAAIVNNNTEQDMPVEVFIEGEGFTTQGDVNQTFTIPAGGRQRIDWPVTINNAANLDLTFFANGGDGAFLDASKPPLGQGADRLIPIYKYEAPDITGTAGMLPDGGSVTEAIALPPRFDVTQGELDISVDPSLAATTVDGLTYLKHFPHQCIEQTVSRFLPNIMTYRALDELGLTDDVLRQELDTAVNFALQRLAAQQHSSGGWGWFVQDRPNPLTSAYALIGLVEARDSGFAVDDRQISRAQSYLRTTFIVPGDNRERWELNRQVFTLYALARSGAPDVARTATMFDHRARLDYYSKAFLALTFNLIDPSDTSRTDTLMSDLINGAVVSATGTHWEEVEDDIWNWNTDTRSTAIVLDALVKLRPDSELGANVVRWLMTARTADAWETTQETAWSVMALTDWMVLTGELNPDYTYSAALNGAMLSQAQAEPDTVRDSLDLVVAVGDLLAEQANELVIERSEGPGVLYYTAHLKVYLPVPEIEPINRGIVVQRQYVSPETGEPVTEARVGDLVQVCLTIITPNDLHYAVIEDPIPAGTEGVNPDLATSEQIGTRPGLDVNDPLSQGWGWWWFSNTEFRDEKVVLYSTYLPAGTYEYVYSIRAGLPGEYNVIPPTGYEFYMPEVFGRGAGSTFTVLPAEQ
jgi:hypothetical protein